MAAAFSDAHYLFNIMPKRGNTTMKKDEVTMQSKLGNQTYSLQ